MGKASKVKYELFEATEMLGLVQTLKDIADNKFFTLMHERDTFRRFGESFVEFFRMISMTKVDHPLITNKNPHVGIIVVTIEGSFLGQFNNSIIRLAVKEAEKHQKVKFIAVGDKSLDTLKGVSGDIKLFTELESRGFYETAILVKDFVIKEVMENRLGKVFVAHSWPKDFDTQKPKLNKLLPCDELVTKQSQFVDELENVIQESDPIEIIGYLSNLWITTRLYEIFVDTTIGSAAAQAAFLEDKIDDMKKENQKVQLKYRKARKSDIDKGLRETFTARMMAMKE